MNNVKDLMLSLTGEEPDEELEHELRYKCPFCGSPKKKFYTNGAAFICFNCSRKGSFLSLVCALLGTKSVRIGKQWLSHHAYEPPALARLDSSSNDLFSELMVLMSGAKSSRTDLASLSIPSIPTHCHYLMDNLSNRRAYPFFTYAHKRGLSLNDIKRFHVSYVEDGTFVKRDGSRAPITDSLVFFAYYHDKPCYWNTRNIYNGVPKSINAPALDNQFSRKDVVFNLNNLKSGQDLAICEGVFNALTVDKIPQVCGVATYGKNISVNQINLISSCSSRIGSYYIGLDADAYDMALKVYKEIRENLPLGKRVYIVDDRSLGHRDFNDIGTKKSAKLINDKAYRPNLLTQLEKMI